MKSALRFLVPYFVAYFAVGLTINVLFGPPGLSDEYRETYGKDHERYLAISKSAEYKLYRERPDFHPPADARSARDFAFADEYVMREAYLDEEQRRERYALYVDVFRALMVLILVLRFGAKPLLRFLDSQVAMVRERLAEVAEERRLALERQHTAERQLASLDSERQKLLDEARARAELESSRIAAATEQALKLLAEEEADRVRNEELIAQRRVKRALVDEAIRLVIEEYTAARTPQSEAALVARFDEQMEQTR